MDSIIRGISAKSVLKVSLLFLIFFGLAAARRWQQLVCPQVWDEDGRIVSDFLSGGWHDFFLPINGYLILAPKIITRMALAVSIYYYPGISTVLACSFAALVSLAVIYSPIHLRGKLFCALSMFVVPTDAEVFGLPLYTLWWAGVLLMLVALWDETLPSVRLRLAFVAVGGLSSPFIFIALPILYFRAFWFRRMHSEKIVALGATAVALVQANFVLRQAAATSPLWISIFKFVVPKFCGWFLLGNFWKSYLLLWPAGLLVMALVAAYLHGSRKSLSSWILVCLYLGAIASSIFRVDPSGFNPVGGGPRYFFFAYLLTFWILVQLIYLTPTRWIRNAAGGVAVVACLNSIPVWTRYHDDLHWSEHLASARLFPEYEIPIEYDGQRFHAWSILEPGPIWNRAIQNDWFVSPGELEQVPTFAYRILGPAPSAPKNSSILASASIGETRDGAISVHSVGSRKVVFLKFSSARKILFRSGPAKDSQSMQVVGYEDVFIPRLPLTADWVVLEFSNAKLPNEFTVKIEVDGQGVGEWASIGSRN